MKVILCLFGVGRFLLQTLILSVPHFFNFGKNEYQSVQGHTGLTNHFYFLTFGHSGAQS